jgi:hypothetical protein
MQLWTFATMVTTTNAIIKWVDLDTSHNGQDFF